MSNIFLTAARITAGSSDNKIPEHKSSLHRRWRFFMSRKRVAIERKSMVMSQKIPIEQNRYAMACASCRIAFFVFYTKNSGK